MEEMRIYIANLGKYNEGELVGAWFTPPVDFEEVKERIGLNDEYEEYAIHDYELPFEIDEYTPIEEINRLCEMVEDLSAFMFPIPLTYLMTTPSMMERYTDKADAFDGLFNMVLGYGIQFLLPCIIGVIAAMLFFMERDNDTFKNLRTIPVTSTQMVLAKIFVLFLFGIIFCVASTIATILCGLGTLEVYGLGYKLFLAVETGIFITAGTLPLIVLVVFFSKTYVFSILLCVFYSVLNMSATALFDALPKTILWFLPTPLTTFWSAGDMAAHGIKMDLEQMTGLIPSTFQVVMILGIMAIISFWLIDRLYKQRGE